MNLAIKSSISLSVLLAPGQHLQILVRLEPKELDFSRHESILKTEDFIKYVKRSTGPCKAHLESWDMPNVEVWVGGVDQAKIIDTDMPQKAHYDGWKYNLTLFDKSNILFLWIFVLFCFALLFK
jgi:hypothetical protein